MPDSSEKEVPNLDERNLLCRTAFCKVYKTDDYQAVKVYSTKELNTRAVMLELNILAQLCVSFQQYNFCKQFVHG